MCSLVRRKKTPTRISEINCSVVIGKCLHYNSWCGQIELTMMNWALSLPFEIKYKEIRQIVFVIWYYVCTEYE